MVDIEKRIQQAEKDFSATISEVQNTTDTMVNRSLLNLAIRQNDLIFTLKKKKGDRQ